MRLGVNVEGWMDPDLAALWLLVRASGRTARFAGGTRTALGPTLVPGPASRDHRVSVKARIKCRVRIERLREVGFSEKSDG
jgi:hypothetical protein